MIWIKKQTINPEVTDYYLEVIGEAYKMQNQEVKYFYKWDEYKPKRSDITVVTRYKELLKMILERRHYVYWVQGLLPEENFALYHSKLRVLFYNLIEKIIIQSTVKRFNYFVMVSQRMKKHYEEKYHIIIDNCYVMPCNNDVIHEQSFLEERKYKDDLFCYEGGLNVWQCIDETLKIYKEIEKTRKNTKLLLLVKNKEKAMKLLQKYEIINFEIDFVPVSMLPEKLKKVKYGFIIRQDLELNRVATPTKLLTYMGTGVIPILSTCLEGLLENVDTTRYVIQMENVDDISPIMSFMDEEVSAEDILIDYKNIYNKHYDKMHHIEEMSKKLPR